MSDNEDESSNKPSNVEAMNTPRWSAEQAMLSAMSEVGEMEVCAIYWKTPDGRHRTVTSSMTPGELLVGGKLIERRGLMGLEGFFNWPS